MCRDASNPPKQITNNNGFIVLRSDGIETSVVVGHGFLLTDGRVEVTVPDVITRDDWSLVREYPFLSVCALMYA